MVELTRKDIEFFKTEGYLVKRNVLNPELMEQARAKLWEGAPEGRKRENPETWVGPFTPEEENPDKDNHRRGFRWNFREPGGEDWMVQLLATDPNVWQMAEQLLGKRNLVQPERVRGIYCTLPYGDVPKKSIGCHVDAHPFHLGAVGYIDDVPPEGGGFTVWPGSHQVFYYDYYSQYKNEPTPQYDVDRERISRGPGIECYGNAGDVVFWHHRIGHAAGHNYSPQIRQAVLYDFRKTELERTQEEPPNEDMWRDWPGIKALENGSA